MRWHDRSVIALFTTGAISALLATSATSAPRPSSPNQSCATDGRFLYCVSSALASQNGFTYGPANLFDTDLRTAWTEGVSGNGVGEWILVDFHGPRTLRQIYIMSGYHKSLDIFEKNGRPRSIRVSTSSGESRIFNLEDSRSVQTLDLTFTQKASWIQVHITSVYAGWKYQDTAITEFVVEAD